MTKNDVDRLALLNYTYGKLTAFRAIPGPTQTLTYYAMECLFQAYRNSCRA